MERLLEGIDLVIFDKDGTLIEFHRMWRDWVGDLGDRIELVTGRPFRSALFELMGVDPIRGTIAPHGLLAATPMSRLRALVVAAVAHEGATAADAETAVEAAWHPPDPVELARPTTDLRTLFQGLVARGIRIAVATSDDRDPTERTLAALGIADLVSAIACADDGRPVKPAPDAVLHLAATVGVAPGRTAVVGDAPADMVMGRAAKAGLVIGVLTGVGDAVRLGGTADVVLGSIAELLPA